MTMRREYRRTKVSAAESAELWERWKKGEGLHAIGQALGRGHTSIAAHVRPSGGIRPPARRRAAALPPRARSGGEPGLRPRLRGAGHGVGEGGGAVETRAAVHREVQRLTAFAHANHRRS